VPWQINFELLDQPGSSKVDLGNERQRRAHGDELVAAIILQLVVQ
jgi:hypothetical protein